WPFRLSCVRAMSESTSQPAFQSLAYVEQLYARYHRDPDSIPAEWREYFARTDGGEGNGTVSLGPSFQPRSIFHAMAWQRDQAGRRPDPRSITLSERLYELIRNHRVRGHIIAAIDPLGGTRPCPPELKLEFYGFTPSEL